MNEFCALVNPKRLKINFNSQKMKMKLMEGFFMGYLKTDLIDGILTFSFK